MALKENYKDDILDVSVNTKRKYRMTENQDGTVSFDDETEYLQEGDNFGSGDINATNSKVNTLDSAVTTLNANLDGFKFYPTGTGIVGLIADDSAYTDEDGNYVVWGTATAEQLVEDNPNTYKSVASEEDTRGKEGADTATPFSKGFEVFHTASGRYGTITRTLKSRPKFACVIVKDTTERSYTTYRDFVNNINYQQQSSRTWGRWNTDTKITFDEQTKVITVVTGSENGDYGCEELYVY